jgi:hypothetical protein
MNNVSGYIPYLQWCIVLLFSVQGVSENFVLSDIGLSGTPQVRGNRIHFAIDLVFQQRPEDYWVYYDQVKQEIVVEFYGVTIKKEETIRLAENEVVEDIEIVNTPTTMSLTKEMARIALAVDPGWHIYASSAKEDIIRIILWRELKTGEAKKKRKALPIAIGILSGFAFGIITFVVLLQVLGE